MTRRYEGACGVQSPATTDHREFCVLEHGHGGWHEGPQLITASALHVPPLRWDRAGAR